MPGSVATFDRANPSSLHGNIVAASTLGELLNLIPAPYRSSMGDLVNEVYRAAIKANNARSYLTSLKQHQQRGTYPPEIEGRVSSPSIQISKEFSMTTESRSFITELRDTAQEAKKTMLEQAISMKQKELGHLQTLFAEAHYNHRVEGSQSEVFALLCSDAGVAPGEDGTFATEGLPAWIASDYLVMKKWGKLFPARAVALAFASVSKENTKKFRALSLKKETDEDIAIQDSNESLQNISQLVAREVRELMKEYKPKQVNKQQGKKAQSTLRPSSSSGKISKAGRKGKQNGKQTGKKGSHKK